MRTLGTIVAVVAALIWSVVVWGGYGLLSISADFLANNANDLGVAPGAEAAFDWVVGIFTNYGSGTAAVVWAMGLLAILLLRAVYNWLIGLLTRDRYDEQPVRSALQEERGTASFEPIAPVQPVVVLPQPSVPEPARWGRDAAGREG